MRSSFEIEIPKK